MTEPEIASHVSMTEAARLLHLDRVTLRKRLRTLGVVTVRNVADRRERLVSRRDLARIERNRLPATADTGEGEPV